MGQPLVVSGPMSSPSPPGDTKFRRWSQNQRLLAWVVGGWLFALVVAPSIRGDLEELNAWTLGPAHGLVNDAASVVATALDQPPRARDLLGSVADPAPGTACALTWTDQENTYVYAQRASRAGSRTAWRAATVSGRAVLARYVADLWAGDCRLPSAHHKEDCTMVGRLRLVERRELAMAAPGKTDPAAPVAILPGQCVLGSFPGSPSVVGRYKVTLPADRQITVRAFVIPATAFLSYRLSLRGKDAPHVQGESTMFRSIGQGEYDLEVSLLPSVGAPDLPGEFSLQVHWGRGAGDRCPIPGFDEKSCYSSPAGGQP